MAQPLVTPLNAHCVGNNGSGKIKLVLSLATMLSTNGNIFNDQPISEIHMKVLQEGRI